MDMIFLEWDGTEIPDMERGNLSIEVSSLNEEESGSVLAAFDCGPQSAGASAAAAESATAAKCVRRCAAPAAAAAPAGQARRPPSKRARITLVGAGSIVRPLSPPNAVV